jgi:hypothetical protein
VIPAHLTSSARVRFLSSPPAASGQILDLYDSNSNAMGAVSANVNGAQHEGDQTDMRTYDQNYGVRCPVQAIFVCCAV